jgi:hypothetical protein
MKSLEEKAMGVESHWRIGRKPGQAMLGWILAMFIVAAAVFGPPLTGQRIAPMIELRHDVLMIDREFDRGSVRLNRSSRPAGGLIIDELGRTGSTDAASKLRSRGGNA